MDEEGGEDNIGQRRQRDVSSRSTKRRRIYLTQDSTNRIEESNVEEEEEHRRDHEGRYDSHSEEGKRFEKHVRATMRFILLKSWNTNQSTLNLKNQATFWNKVFEGDKKRNQKEVLKAARYYLDKLFGFKLVQEPNFIPNSSTVRNENEYVLISAFDKQDECIETMDTEEAKRRGCILLVLSYILISNGVVADYTNLENFVTQKLKVKHDDAGEFLSYAVRRGYVRKFRSDGSSDSFAVTLGPRALTEIGLEKLLEYVLKVQNLQFDIARKRRIISQLQKNIQDAKAGGS